MLKRLALILLILAGGLLAQEADRVRPALERTDEVIEGVRPLVRAVGREDAIALLKKAVATQERAWESFNGRRYRAAYDLTMAARRDAQQAALLSKVDPERAKAELERTRNLMREAGPVITRSENPEALGLWKMATNEQDAAGKQFQVKRYGLAVKFTLAARLHTLGALRLVRGAVAVERVEVEIERTDELIRRATEQARLIGSERAKQLLEKANLWQEQARQALANRMPVQALKLTLSARDLILRAWEVARGARNPELVERALIETDRLIAEWSDDIEAGPSAEARQLLAQAVDQQAIARQQFEAKDLAKALLTTSQSRRFVNRAVDLIHSDETDKLPSDDEE